MSATLTGLELPPVITVGNRSFTTNPLLTSEQIQTRVTELGSELAARYEGVDNVHLITVLNGALHFASDLRRSMEAAKPDTRITSDEVKVASYTGTQSSGVLRFQSAPSASVEGKHVVLVEDIYDTGLTLKWLTEYFKCQEPASLEVVIAVNKLNPERQPGLLGSTALHVGFEIPNEFVIGYGLDIDEQYRELEGIYTLTEVA